jgi:hypothetical protein
MADAKRNAYSEAAMSFEEIGKELGIGASGAWMLYRSALRKLQRPCAARDVRLLKELVEFRERREA